MIRACRLLGAGCGCAVSVGQCERREMDAWVEGVHQGVVADVSPSQVWGEAMLDELLDRTEGAPLLLVLDGVTDPHNLGACLRTADAAGALAVIVPKDKSATLNATVRKVACGAAEVIPLVAVTNWRAAWRSSSSAVCGLSVRLARRRWSSMSTT